jgi:outer membrane protein
MKKILLVVCGLWLASFAAEAQKYAIIDTKYILDKMPEYRDAQKKLDDFAQVWQKEIDDQQTELDKMYRDFEAEQVMLSEELKKTRACKACPGQGLQRNPEDGCSPQLRFYFR